MLETLLKAALAHAPDLVLSLIVLVLIPFAVRWLRSKTTAQNLAIIADAAEVAYWVVNQIARKTPNQLDDKAAEALRVMRDELRVVKTPLDESRARAALKSIHEKQISQEVTQ